MQLIYFLYKILGIFAYTSNRYYVNSVKEVPFMWFIYSMCFAVCYAVFHIFVTFTYLERPPVQFNFVSILIYFYNTYCEVIYVWLFMVLGLVKHKKIMEADRDLAVCDNEFREYLQVIITDANFRQFQYLQNGLICLGFVMLESIESTFEPREYVEICIACNVISIMPPIITTLIETQFIGFTQLIQERYRQLNKLIYKFCGKMIEENHDKYFRLSLDKLPWETNVKPSIFVTELCLGASRKVKIGVVETRKRMFLAETINYNEKLRHIDVIYTRLYNTSRLIESVFGIQIVIMLTIYFVQLTTLLYTSCQLFITCIISQTGAKNFSKLLFTRLLWVSIYLYKTFTLCLNSYRVTKEAKHVGSYLHHFGFNTDDPVKKTRVKLFSLKVLQQKVIFMPCGMFQIDLKLMFMIIGGIATYILILIQFDVALNQGPTHVGLNSTMENTTQALTSTENEAVGRL